MKKRITVLIFILIVITSIIGFVHTKGQSDKLTLYGNIEIRQVDMGFQVEGRILKMLKEEGDSVKVNELIAILDDKDYFSDVEKATADVAKTLALKNDAEQKYERNYPLCSDNIISKQECDTLSNIKNKTEADYKAALAQQISAQNRLDYTKLYAPDEGYVTVRVREVGSTVNKGQTVYTISKTKPVWIRAYVNEVDLGNIKYGMGVKVYTDSVNPLTGKKREYQGYIGYISPVAEFTPKTVQTTDLRTSLVYRIRVYINDIDEFLRQGMPTTVKIDLISGNTNENSKN